MLRIACWTLLAALVPLSAAPLDLRNATVVAPATLTPRERKAVALLVEEVERRTLLHWPVAAAPPGGGAPCIAIALASAGRPAEGYRLQSSAPGPCAVTITGNDSRGVLFGAGRLLRELIMSRGAVTLRENWTVESAPRFPVRGHQLGYRHGNNTYDAWTVAQYEQYIRDLILFGANTIELTADNGGPDGPQFTLPAARMHREISRLCDEYGLDLSIWYPAIAKSYEDPAVVEAEVKRWDETFRSLPRLDAVFVPGGDPGHTEPRILFPFLEKATAALHRRHPRAGMWVSPQGMDETWAGQFIELAAARPAWLAGLVHGPWVRVPMAKLRAAIPAELPIRLYPDITHTLRCQFPLPDWDPAFASTHGREPIMPMPVRESAIFARYSPGSNGFVSYSDGAGDDVNKIVWTALAWDPATSVRTIVDEYARVFIGVPAFADGLLALERNWHGPLSANAGVETALAQFQEMERTAPPSLRRNWRFEQALYRAYFDAYTRRRLTFEQSVEDRAREHLAAARERGSLAALDAAEAELRRTQSPPAADLRLRIFELAAGLFEGLGSQLSVSRYGASGAERGATLDHVDAPLTNARWWLTRIPVIRELREEKARLAEISTLLHWEDPGPGGFYDDLGDPARQPHLLPDPHPEDPGGLQGFDERIPGPRSWISHANSWKGRPIRMRYSGLDPAARYKVRVVYGGENAVQAQGIRLLANDGHVIHPYLPKPLPVRPVEFSIPAEATRGGSLELRWDREEPPSGRLRGVQISEVWLIREP